MNWQSVLLNTEYLGKYKWNKRFLHGTIESENLNFTVVADGFKG